MDHREYIDRYLGLSDDDEFSAEERQAISDHVTSCKDCETLLANDQFARATLKQNVRIIPAPDATLVRS